MIAADVEMAKKRSRWRKLTSAIASYFIVPIALCFIGGMLIGFYASACVHAMGRL